MVQESCHTATHGLEFNSDHFFDDLVVDEDDFELLLLLPPPLLLDEPELSSVVWEALTVSPNNRFCFLNDHLGRNSNYTQLT